MKIKNLIFIAVIFAFAVACENNKNVNPENTEKTAKDSVEITDNKNNNTSEAYSGKIAYINIDTLLINYELYKKLEKKLKAKYQASEREFNRKRDALEKEVIAFKQKEANNAFLSQESYMSQGQELMMKEQQLQELNAKLTQEIADEEARLNQQIKDSIDSFIEEFNKNENYDFILNKAFMIYGKKSFDITDTILTLLNDRYRKSIEQKNK
jgi:outer membrane protein